MQVTALSSSAVVCRAGPVARPSARRALVAAPLRKAAKSSRFVARAEATETVDVEKVVKELQEKWDKVENKTGVIVYGTGGLVALWLAATVVGALNNIPLLPKIFELVGLGYSAWFTYRYLLFKSSREELLEDVESLKKKISGEQ